MLPFVSILIPTYARVAWLEEALYCILHQDYGGPLEVLVCNDCPRQTLMCNDGNVKIINVRQYPTLGIKRNCMVSAAAGDYVAWLDDDDLALPWYIDRLVRPLENTSAKAVISRKCYTIYCGMWGPSSVSIEMLCDREHTFRVGGFPSDIDSGEDQVLQGRLENAGGVITITDEPGAYVYRWGQGTYHISGLGFPLDGDAFRRDADWRINSGYEPSGTVKLTPRLRRDYFTGAPAEVLRRLPASFRP